MSANDEVLIRRKQNGLYEIRHLWAEDGTVEELTISTIADDIDGLENAVDRANKYLEEEADEGRYVEYGLRILNH